MLDGPQILELIQYVLYLYHVLYFAGRSKGRGYLLFIKCQALCLLFYICCFIPFLQLPIWLRVLSPLSPKVSEQTNGITRTQLDKPQNQNEQESYYPNPTASVRRLSRPSVHRNEDSYPGGLLASYRTTIPLVTWLGPQIS